MKSKVSLHCKILLVTLFAFSINFGDSCAFEYELSKIFDVSGDSVKQTNDGGYIMVSGADLIKTDSDGEQQWRKTFPEASSFSSVMQTTDEGYILSGEGRCDHCYYHSSPGPANCGMIKTDADGNLQWGQIESSEGGDPCYSISAIQTDDGAYVFLGGVVDFKYGYTDVSFYKTDTNGNSLWGVEIEDEFLAKSIAQTSDGGYIVLDHNWEGTYTLFRSDAEGNEMWKKNFVGQVIDDAKGKVQQTADDGFIIAGSTESFGAGVSDVYLIKTDTDGDQLWSKTFGGVADDFGNSVQQTADGGFIIAGSTESFGAGGSDVYLIKTDTEGNEMWSKAFGGTENDFGRSVQENPNGVYLVFGLTHSFGADGKVYQVYYKPWLLFNPAINYDVGESPGSVAIGDLNGDAKPDLVAANLSSNNVSVLLGNGDGTFQSAVNYVAGDGPRSVAIGDLNGDGNPDIVTSGVSVLLGNGDGTFQSAVNYVAGDGPRSVAISDLNGDNNPDVAVANQWSNNVSVLLGNGDGTFQSTLNYCVGSEPASVAIGDMNGDTKPDLALADGGYKCRQAGVSMLFGNGDGTFGDVVHYGVVCGQFSPIAIGDLNSDGNLDIVAASELCYYTDWCDGYILVLLGNGDGTFQSAMNYAAADNPTSLAIGDLNGDNAIDLAVANMDRGNVSILINTGVRQNPDNNHWYQRFDESMTWHDAKAHCESLGGYLATVTSQTEHEFVYGNLGSASLNQLYWLGATDETQEGVWQWVTGETWDYTNWSENEPNNCNDAEHYLTVFTPNDPHGRAGFWNDIGEGNDGGCGCGDCLNVYRSISTICEWNPLCKADFNDDGKVDSADLEIFSFALGKLDCTLWPSLCDCDTDGDKDVDGADLGVLAVEFGRTDCP